MTTADDATTHALLTCLVRELSAPEGQARLDGSHLVVRLPRHDAVLRARVRRPSLTGTHRLDGPVQAWDGAEWRPAGWREVAEAVGAELTLATGVANPEFVDQVASSRETVDAVLRRRAADTADVPTGLDDVRAAYVASEQSLVLGHRQHPTPKARSGSVADWLRYAPEARTRFRMWQVAVRHDLVRDARVDTGTVHPLDVLAGSAAVPSSHRLVPVHPWQWDRLRAHPRVREALADGRLADLGQGGPEVVPTSSVRTVYDPAGDLFVKGSLHVRITNCVRKNSAYELAGAVHLTRLLRPVADDLGARFPGVRVLAEPASRTVDLDGDRELFDGFGVIVRDGLRHHLDEGVTPLLAGAVAAGPHAGAAAAAALLARPDGPAGGSARSGADHALAWWDAYVGLLLPPVLHAFFHHGVVFEPHLQNVLVGVGADGVPRQVLLRDMEGTKLVGARHADALASLPEDVRAQVTYDAARGWNRVVYCLLVNHLAEVLAAVADEHPALEPALWARVRDHVVGYRREHGDSPQLRTLLSGVPLPGKANLLTRWRRTADRHATYVPVPNPLGRSVPAPAADAADVSTPLAAEAAR